MIENLFFGFPLPKSRAGAEGGVEGKDITNILNSQSPQVFGIWQEAV